MRLYEVWNISTRSNWKQSSIFLKAVIWKIFIIIAKDSKSVQVVFVIKRVQCYFLLETVHCVYWPFLNPLVSYPIQPTMSPIHTNQAKIAVLCLFTHLTLIFNCLLPLLKLFQMKLIIKFWNLRPKNNRLQKIFYSFIQFKFYFDEFHIENFHFNLIKTILINKNYSQKY